MIEDIQATFLHRFVTVARSRVTNAIAIVQDADSARYAIAARELHSLAGEAGLLGIANIVPVARRAEDQAKKLPASRAEILTTLSELAALVDGLTAS